MTRDETDDIGHDDPTRRTYVKYGGALVGGGLLAGCAGENGSGSESTGTVSPAPADADTATGTATETGTDAASETATGDGPYSVTMAPMGEVTFDAMPERIFTRLTHLAGMAFALGRGNNVNAMHAPEYYDALWNQFTPRLEGVSLDWSGLYSSWEPSKEKLYELDSDVHLADPASVSALAGWDESDTDEIAGNVGPWFGNKFSDRNDDPPEEWVDRYEYYTLWEMFERVAAAFGEEDRYEALAAVRSELLDAIESGLPPEDERPTAAMVGASDVESIYAYRLDADGFLTAHTRPLGATGAFGDDISSGDTVDMEGMLEADPDALFLLGGMSPGTDVAKIRADLRDHPVGSQLSAVRHDRLYAQGARYQGPVLNLFQLEMGAKQLYPDVFGEWPTYTEGPYPEMPAEERLFDYGRVAAIVDGEF